jgi:DNA-directed RNA polymerase subunit RPC12/RpoP
MEVSPERPILELPPTAVAPSVHATGADFDRAVRRSAVRLCRRRVPHERELMIFCGVILAALATNEAVALWTPWEYGGLFAWRELVDVLAVLGAWLAWYALRVQFQAGLIVERRRCFHCGLSLLETLTDGTGGGTCPRCASPFNLGMYHPPTGCLEALQNARARTLRRYPPVAVELPRPVPHWSPVDLDDLPCVAMARREQDRLVAGAAERLVLREHIMAVIALVVAAGWVPLVALTNVFNPGLADAAIAIPAALLCVALIWSSYGLAKERIVRERRCLRCGSALPWPADGGTHDAVICPGCDHAVLPRDYDCLDVHRYEPAWRSLRAVWNPSLAMPPHPPPPDAGARGLSAGSILVARLRHTVRAVRKRLRRL